MREILSRGKRLDNDEWVEGFYVCLNGKEHRIYSGFAETDCGDYYPDLYTVDPETVGQFTGLTDKNGKKIFEGDIISQELCLNTMVREVVSVIEYGIGYAYSQAYGVCQRFRDGSGVSLLSVYGKSGTVHCEVIGNIHDNPELLNGGNENG